MALSPPKASSAGLRARHAAKSDTTASTLIHAIVTVCTGWIRLKVSGVPICGTDTIRVSIIPRRTLTPEIAKDVAAHEVASKVFEESLESTVKPDFHQWVAAPCITGMSVYLLTDVL